jgi:hypothetical protein
MARLTRRRVNQKGRTVGLDNFLMLPHFLLKSEAWRSLSPVGRALFIEVAQRWNGFNNGKIGLGIREAGQNIRVKHTTAVAAFRVLQERGFLVMTRDSSFDQKRLTREWRVTAFPVGDYRQPKALATKEYLRWRRPSENQNAGPFEDPHRNQTEPDRPQSQAEDVATGSPIGPISVTPASR